MAVALFGTGCSASQYLNGARFADRDYAPESSRGFDASGCGIIDPTLIAKNEETRLRNAEHTNDGPKLVTTTSKSWTTQGCGMQKYCAVETTTLTVEESKQEKIFTGVTENSYYVVSEGPNVLLFERPPAEKYRADSGLLVENKWSDEDGDHYFSWVKKTGWEFIIPKEPGQVGSRLVFKQLETEVHPDGTTRPRGTPVARCELVPQPAP